MHLQRLIVAAGLALAGALAVLAPTDTHWSGDDPSTGAIVLAGERSPDAPPGNSVDDTHW